MGAHVASHASPRGFDLPPHPADIYATQMLEMSGPMDAEKLARALAAPALGLLRAKGFVTAQDGQTWAIQVVGARHRAASASAPASHVGRIVCIGLKHELDREALQALAQPG
ncbi:MAG: GTP-binding protein [Hyphomicrobiaceae bacterium]